MRCYGSIVVKLLIYMIFFVDKDLSDYFECIGSEAEDILLHRYVAGLAPKRSKIMKNTRWIYFVNTNFMGIFKINIPEQTL